jgi:hypothetical protein
MKKGRSGIAPFIDFCLSKISLADSLQRLCQALGNLFISLRTTCEILIAFLLLTHISIIRLCAGQSEQQATIQEHFPQLSEAVFFLAEIALLVAGLQHAAILHDHAELSAEADLATDAPSPPTTTRLSVPCDETPQNALLDYRVVY